MCACLSICAALHSISCLRLTMARQWLELLTITVCFVSVRSGLRLLPFASSASTSASVSSSRMRKSLWQSSKTARGYQWTMSLRGTGRKSSRLPPAVRALQSRSGSDRAGRGELRAAVERHCEGDFSISKVLSGSQFCSVSRSSYTCSLLTRVQNDALGFESVSCLGLVDWLPELSRDSLIIRQYAWLL